jgi:hypothetical protein
MKLLTSTRSRPLTGPEDYPTLMDFYQQCEGADRMALLVHSAMGTSQRKKTPEKTAKMDGFSL